MKCLSEVIAWVCLSQLFPSTFVLISFDFMSTCSNSTLFPLLFLHVLHIPVPQSRATPFSPASTEHFLKRAALWAAELMIPGSQQLCVSWLGSLTSNKVWLPIKAFPVADTGLTALSHVDAQRSNKGELITRSRLQWGNACTLSPLPDFFVFSKLVKTKYFVFWQISVKMATKLKCDWGYSKGHTNTYQVSLRIWAKDCCFYMRLHLSQSKDLYLKSDFVLNGIFFPLNCWWM